MSGKAKFAGIPSPSEAARGIPPQFRGGTALKTDTEKLLGKVIAGAKEMLLAYFSDGKECLTHHILRDILGARDDATMNAAAVLWKASPISAAFTELMAERRIKAWKALDGNYRYQIVPPKGEPPR